MTSIFTPEKTIRYAETRLFGSNVTPDMVGRIELHNGVLPYKLEQAIRKRTGKEAQRVVQENGREPIYFSDGTLFIPQYSSFERGTRYERMIERYIAESGRDIKAEACELEGNGRVTYIAYDNNAYDFVVGMFIPERKHENRRVFPWKDVKDITRIILGPTSAVAKRVRVIERGASEYLDAQIVEIDREKALNIGYVYGGQGGLIIGKMMREYAALAKKREEKTEIDISMFGRVGGLNEGAQRHDLIFPTGMIDWVKLKDGKREVHPMDNTLARGAEAYVLNVPTVIDETEEQLLAAREAGCAAVEMETRDIVDAVNLSLRRHPELSIRFGFVGHVSDIPLTGDTLDIELDSDKGERAALEAILQKR